jgi:LL-diaminopimelate aminotransferase
MDKISTHFFSKLDEKFSILQTLGKKVIRLDVGSPDLPPHPSVIDALCHTAAKPHTHGYQAHISPRVYREAWASTYKHLYSTELDPGSEIVPLIGSKGGIFNLSQAVVNPGDIVLIPDPHYPTYIRGTLFADGTPYFMPLHKGNNYLPDLKTIPEEIAQQAKILWINYPNNPTGAVATLEFFQEVVEFAKEYDILLCHDAAYTRVFFSDFQPPSIMQVPGAKEVAVEFNSLSKSHNMAGWRIGAVVGNPDILKVIMILKTNSDSGHFLPILEAARCALMIEKDWLDQRNETYRRRREVITNSLQGLGVALQAPQASLYVWCPVPSNWTSLDFTTILLEQTGVSVAPGTVFGSRGEGYFRISLTQPIELLEEAMKRIESWWPD